jgi:hypothetical protein
VNGKELVFKTPGEETEDVEDTRDGSEVGEDEDEGMDNNIVDPAGPVRVAEVPRIVLHDDG